MKSKRLLLYVYSGTGICKCGGCKLSGRISKGLINFKDLSLEFNLEQWSGVQVFFATTKPDVNSFGTFLKSSQWVETPSCLCILYWPSYVAPRCPGGPCWASARPGMAGGVGTGLSGMTPMASLYTTKDVGVGGLRFLKLYCDFLSSFKSQTK